MKIMKLAKLLIAIQVGIVSSSVMAEPNAKVDDAAKKYSPYAIQICQ